MEQNEFFQISAQGTNVNGGTGYFENINLTIKRNCYKEDWATYEGQTERTELNQDCSTIYEGNSVVNCPNKRQGDHHVVSLIKGSNYVYDSNVSFSMPKDHSPFGIWVQNKIPKFSRNTIFNNSLSLAIVFKLTDTSSTLESIVEQTNIVKNDPNTGYSHSYGNNFAWGEKTVIKFSNSVIVGNKHEGLIYNNGQGSITFEGAFLCSNTFDSKAGVNLGCTKTVNLPNVFCGKETEIFSKKKKTEAMIKKFAFQFGLIKN